MSAHPATNPPKSIELDGMRARFTHHVLILADGYQVGVSVGGRGVPLVFFHGFGMDGSLYLRVLNKLPQLGFLVIAIDAPGHGRSDAPAAGNDTFGLRVQLSAQVLDALGISRAVLVGHSMGGRIAAELAALQPDRALAVILINAAVGPRFDEIRSWIGSPLKLTASLCAAASDTLCERVGLRRLDHFKRAASWARLLARTLTHPQPFFAAASAIVYADASSIALAKLGFDKTHVVVIHGEKDMIVSLDSALDAAAFSAAVLVTLPRAHHSWILSSPWTFVDILRRLLEEHRLGARAESALAAGPNAWLVAHPTYGLYAPNAPVLRMAARTEVLGHAPPCRPQHLHEFTICDAGDHGAAL